MADRNERHFLEFYTPTRFRQRRAVQSEFQHRNATLYDKENPPGTSGGKGEINNQHSRRLRLFTRSANKLDGFHGDNHFETTTRDLENIHCEATTWIKLKSSSGVSEYASPRENSSRVHRALLSVDDANGIIASPSYTSPSTGTTNFLLNDYRSKQSLLSSSKTRVSSFSSPIPGGLRLRSPSFWKFGKIENNRDSDERNQEHPDLNLILPTISTAETNASPNAIAALTSTEGTNNKDFQTTSSPLNAESTAPKRNNLWSPPGTSRILRKYRQRAHEREVKQHSYSPPFQSPRSGGTLTTPRTTRRIRHRLLVLGAKRCRNDRQTLQSRTIANDESADHVTETVITVQNTTNNKDIKTLEYSVDDDRSLLSPSAANRLQLDIESQRHSRDHAKHTTSNLKDAENDKALGITAQTKSAEEKMGNTNLVDPDVSEDLDGLNAHPDTLPSHSSKLATDPFSIATGETAIAELSLEELNERDIQDGVITRRPPIKTEDDVLKDTATTENVPKDVSPSTKSSRIKDEGSGIFQFTQSATNVRRKSLAAAVKAVSVAEMVVPCNIPSDSKFPPEPPSSSVPPSPRHQSRQSEQETVASDTPSSKSSLQSIWDTLNCGGESGRYSVDSPESRDANINIVSRCSDCVNPMASTLMKMWREEEKGESGILTQEGENQLQSNGKGKKQVDDDDNNNTAGWTSPPRKAFSSDLTLVYGLERVENLTLARPRPLLATQSHPLRPFTCYQSNE